LAKDIARTEQVSPILLIFRKLRKARPAFSVLDVQLQEILEDTSGYSKKDKCIQDVLELENMINLWHCILFTNE
jgi:hypothetical protein